MTTRRAIVAWLALLALLALTVGSSFVPLGHFNVVLNFAIAFAKAAIVASVFMDLARGTPAIRLTAIIGLVWLSFLGGLAVTDLLARGAT